MHWTVDDELRFGLDVADFIDTIRDAEDAPQQLIALIEDQMLIAGMTLPDHVVPLALTDILRRLNTKRVRRITERLPRCRGILLSMLLAWKVRALIIAEDSRERCKGSKLRPRNNGR